MTQNKECHRIVKKVEPKTKGYEQLKEFVEENSGVTFQALVLNKSLARVYGYHGRTVFDPDGVILYETNTSSVVQIQQEKEHTGSRLYDKDISITSISNSEQNAREAGRTIDSLFGSEAFKD